MRRLYLFPHRNYVASDSRFRTAKQFVNDLQLIAAAKLPGFWQAPSPYADYRDRCMFAVETSRSIQAPVASRSSNST